MFILDGKRINIDAQLTLWPINGAKWTALRPDAPVDSNSALVFPARYFIDPASREEYGIEEVADPVRGDERYYFVQENADGTITNTLKPVSMLVDNQLLLINGECENRMQALKQGYPESEVASWSKQESEARALIADIEAPTPLISALAGERQLPISELATRIVAKSDAFAVISGVIIGTRQRLEDALKALPDTASLDDILAITWPVDVVPPDNATNGE